MTNQHVIGPSELISVQFDAKRKVAAKVLAFDAERDVAVLYADLSAFPGALPRQSPRRRQAANLPSRARECFTIGSPLGLKKIITSGIVSKVEARAIISDVKSSITAILAGHCSIRSAKSSESPRFWCRAEMGPGVTGVVRIDQTLPVLAQARKKMKDTSLPSARLLPVEPSDPYPLDSLKEMIKPAKFDRKPYIFTMGGFDVALGTPVLEYEIQEEVRACRRSRKKRKERNKRKEPFRTHFEPLQDLRGMGRVRGRIQAGASRASGAPIARDVPVRFGPRTGSLDRVVRWRPPHEIQDRFYRMKLLCGGEGSRAHPARQSRDGRQCAQLRL